MKLGVFDQVEGVFGSIGTDFPPFSEPMNDLGGGVNLLYQCVIHCLLKRPYRGIVLDGRVHDRDLLS